LTTFSQNFSISHTQETAALKVTGKKNTKFGESLTQN